MSTYMIVPELRDRFEEGWKSLGYASRARLIGLVTAQDGEGVIDPQILTAFAQPGRELLPDEALVSARAGEIVRLPSQMIELLRQKARGDRR